MILLNTHDLFNKSTHNSRQRTICWNARPCFRDGCYFCRNRRKRFGKKQIEEFKEKWNLNTFLTITCLNFHGAEYEAFDLLLRLRAKLNPYIARRSKYIGVSSVNERIDLVRKTSSLTPHFHYMVSDSIQKDKLKSFLDKKFPEIKLKIQDEAITNIKGLLSYFYDENYFKSSEKRPPRARLLTCSSGLYLGRPKALPIKSKEGL